jgi:UDP-N-acetylmuramoyl-L-alanyl-D-glutamate--2,6-diaminopimelate ligase
VTLRELVSRAPSLPKTAVNDAFAREVTGLSYDSRQVTSGSVFVAMRGQKAEGAAFAKQAIERGAQAVVADTPRPADIPADVPWLETADARLALAELAAAFFGHPSHDLIVVGITGTNGKTTTSYLTASVFDRAGIPCGVIGTVGHRLPPADARSKGEEREAARTTPEAPDVQALLAEMASRGAGACVMEVSSHALELRRADGIRFAGAIFTNLTRDHLDFHGDMETYYAAKRRLFEMLPPGAPSAINVDDPRGSTLAAAVSRPVTYALDRPADVTAGPLALSIDGLSLDVRTPRGALHVRSRLVGRPNAYNILAAVACAVALDLPLGAIEQGIAALEQVPGRFEVVSLPGDDVRVVVDYAHTDDALRNLLETARPLADGRLITVFGCGGDRDRTKRPLMGAVAGRLSDLIIVTSDNPRSEDPARIIEEILRGITPDTRRDTAQRLMTVPDRHDAIRTAIDLARPGDLVLIAGKGHEKYQVIGSQVLPFDDVAVARDALGRRRSNSGVR